MPLGYRCSSPDRSLIPVRNAVLGPRAAQPKSPAAHSVSNQNSLSGIQFAAVEASSIISLVPLPPMFRTSDLGGAPVWQASGPFFQKRYEEKNHDLFTASTTLHGNGRIACVGVPAHDNLLGTGPKRRPTATAAADPTGEAAASGPIDASAASTTTATTRSPLHPNRRWDVGDSSHTA